MLSWPDESSDGPTVNFATCRPTSSISTTEAIEEVSTASESESESTQDGMSDDSDMEDKQCRRVPPPIFFGTPSQAEHDKMQLYASHARTRKLLRKDSLELTRRKSVGSDRGRSSMEGTTQGVEERPKQRVASLAELGAIASDENDISALALSDGERSCNEERESIQGDDSDNDGVDSDSDTGDESSCADSSDDGGGRAGDRTIRVQDALQGLQQDTHEEQPPSTPTKQIMRPYISRPSLAPSDADSSPGIALALHPSSAHRPSPFFRPSPASSSKSRHLASPSSENAPPLDSLQLNAGLLELEKEGQSSQSNRPRKSILQESPSKVNQAVPPSKSTHASSPTKVVVRQTLSAWAHAKLKTPQSPEKREWEKLQAEAVSPSRPSNASSSVASSVKEGAIKSATTGAAAAVQSYQWVDVSTSVAIKAPLTSNTSGKPGQDHIVQPPSRLARPVPASRLPKPVQRPTFTAAATPSGTAAKRMVVPNGAPTFRRIAATSSSSTLRPAAVRGTFQVFAGPTSAPRARLTSSMPLRAPSKQLQLSDRSPAVRLTASHSSSPAKAAPSPSMQRLNQSSPPFKRVGAASAPVVVRDARLFAAPRRLPEASSEHSSSSSSSSSSPATMTTPLPSTLGPPSPASMPMQASTGVGAARRVIISRDHVQPNDESRHRVTQRAERLHDEKRGLRIKEITMGRTLAHEKNAFNEDQDFVPLTARKTDLTASAAPQRSHIQEGRTECSRSSRRKYEKQSTAKSSKQSKSSSVFLSSSSSDRMREKVPLSKTELSRLTTLHTQRNEQFVSQLETVVVRKIGELRPSSPSSKIRKTVGSASAGVGAMTAGAAREARKQRANRRTPDAFEKEKEEKALSLHDQNHRHLIGAGEDESYITPPRRSTIQSHRVRWHKSLFHGPNEAKSDGISSATQIKGCLKNKDDPLDSSGNALEATQPWSPRLTKNKVTIYKLVYDDDEQ